MEKTIEELQSEIATLQSEKAGLVGETQDLRKSRQEKDTEIEGLKELVKQATDKNNADPEEGKIIAVVQKVLGNVAQQSAEKNRKAAFDKFVTENKEYHQDNDPTGLKRAALEREFGSFNTAGLVETEDFVKVIGKANALLRGSDTRDSDESTQIISSSSSTPAAPAAGLDKDLSPQEAELIKRNGWTKEKFLGLKAKMPGFVRELVAGVRT